MSALRLVPAGTAHHPRLVCDGTDCARLLIGKHGQPLRVLRREAARDGWWVNVTRPGVRVRDYCPDHRELAERLEASHGPR